MTSTATRAAVYRRSHDSRGPDTIPDFLPSTLSTRELVLGLTQADIGVIAEPATFPFRSMRHHRDLPSFAVCIDDLEERLLGRLLNSGELATLSPADALVSSDESRLERIEEQLGPSRFGHIPLTDPSSETLLETAVQAYEAAVVAESEATSSGGHAWLVPGPNTAASKSAIQNVARELAASIDASLAFAENIADTTVAVYGPNAEKWS
ncbi:MAG: hypothetical protein ACR2PK_08175, partial [Acidimicrobiales bacterium]